MTLEHSRLIDLLNGRYDPLWICNVPERVRQFFNCSVGAVYLSTDSANHILKRHTEISTFDLLLLPIAIERGIFFSDPKNIKFIGSIYHLEDERAYYVPMKVTEKGHEIWVSSMHRLSRRQIAQKWQTLNHIK